MGSQEVMKVKMVRVHGLPEGEGARCIISACARSPLPWGDPTREALQDRRDSGEAAKSAPRLHIKMAAHTYLAHDYLSSGCWVAGRHVGMGEGPGEGSSALPQYAEHEACMY